MPQNEFIEFVKTCPDPLPKLLPLVHTTATQFAMQIFEAGKIRVQDCPVFKEPLIYFFYGCARYRAAIQGPTKALCWYPIAFILEINAATSTPKRVYPFDTGAFKGNVYGNANFHPNMQLDEFALEGGFDGARKCVKRFFDTNEKYLKGTRVENLQYPAANLHVNSYYEHLASEGSADDRRSAIEVQFASDLDLPDAKVIAVIVPETLLDDGEFVASVEKSCKIKPLGYDPARASSDVNYGALGQRAMDILKGMAS